jgi:hypothetical protein
MGEVKRCKTAGTYPAQDDPLAAVRRFWCGRTDGGRVEDFRAPEGTIAITLDVQGVAPSTCIVDAARVVDVIAEVNRLTAGMDYYRVVRFVGSQFLKAKQTGDDAAFKWIGLACLWTALHHPKVGADLRKAISDGLRKDGKAHISWRFSPTTGLAMPLSEKFVDLEGLAALAPQDSVIAYIVPSDDGGVQH